MMDRRDVLIRGAMLGVAAVQAGPAVAAVGAGKSSAGDAAIAAKAQEIGALGAIVLQGGAPRVTYGTVDRPCIVHSIRKSFMSALYGQAVERGEIRLDATLADLGIDENPPLTEAEKRATVADILSARSGVYLPAPPTPDGRQLLPPRGSQAPGAHWVYSNWDFNVLGNIYERKTTKNVFLGLDHYLAKPLGFEDWDLFRDTYSDYRADPAGATLRYPNYRMAMSARDMAKFGQLYLQNGVWKGEQIVPADWVRASTRPISKAPGEGPPMEAYGYLWWVATDPTSGIPVGTYSAAGLGGSYITVLPSLDAVVVMQVDSRAKDFRPVPRESYASLLKLVATTLSRA